MNEYFLYTKKIQCKYASIEDFDNHCKYIPYKSIDYTDHFVVVIFYMISDSDHTPELSPSETYLQRLSGGIVLMLQLTRI